METICKYIAKEIPALNRLLFKEVGCVVTSLKPFENTIDVHILSNCGSMSHEASLFSKDDFNWAEELFNSIITDSELMSVVADCQFKEFRKSELFRLIYSEIIYPIQVLSDFSFSSFENGSTIINDEIILTGICHADLNGHKRIEYIRGEIPWADEFHIWQDELDCLKRPDEFTLPEHIKQIAARILEIGEYEISANDLKKASIHNSRLFSPESPQELWKMHRLMGTLV